MILTFIAGKDPAKRTRDVAGPVLQFAPPFHFRENHPETSDEVTLDHAMVFHRLVPGNVIVQDVMDNQSGRLCYVYDRL